MTKILFIHNTVMWYRKPFFKKLSEIFEINFIFTHFQVSKDIYNVEFSNKIEGLETVNYKILKNYFGIALGVFKESLGDYDVLVGGNWDSLTELIETLIYFGISKIRRKKYILWSEEWGWKSISFKKRIILPLIKFIVHNSNAIIVPGHKHKEYFISLGAVPEKVFLMPNVSNVTSTKDDYHNKKRLIKELGLENKKIILYVGRLVKRKGVECLIKSFSKLKSEKENIILIILGDGESKNELKNLTKELKIDKNVYFKGQVENKELSSYYILSNVCIIPSITLGIGDPWVFVLNEAMYFGKPVIATEAVGAAYDMIKNGKNGYLVPEKDVDSIYLSMKKILSDDILEKNMGINSKKIISERFQYKNMIDGFNNAINYVKRK